MSRPVKEKISFNPHFFFTALSGALLEKEIVWKVNVFTPENAKPGNVIFYEAFRILLTVTQLSTKA